MLSIFGYTKLYEWQRSLTMMRFQINSNDTNAIEQLLHITKEQFNLQIKILNNINFPPKKRTKWGEFAD